MKTISIYRQTGYEAKEIQTFIAGISFLMCRHLDQFKLLFYAAFKAQKRQRNMPAKAAF